MFMDNDTVTTDIREINYKTAETEFRPRAGECLVCYVHRQLGVHGCDDTHRFAESFRDQTAPRATALIPRLRGFGARRCDCELLREVYTFAPRPLLARGTVAGTIGARLGTDDLFDIGVLRKVREYEPGGEYWRERVYEDITRFGNARSYRYGGEYGYSDGSGYASEHNLVAGEGAYTEHQWESVRRYADAHSVDVPRVGEYSAPHWDDGGFGGTESAEYPYHSNGYRGHELEDPADPFGPGFRIRRVEQAEEIYLCCQYVRRGSTQPCGNWQRGRRRPRWTPPVPPWGMEEPGWGIETQDDPGLRAPF
ncbi:hypothetical protein JCM18882A_29340 [Brevibacterium metallidurans]|uniref:DUF2695 domain-containing protein n=2 Tax=Brevibacterium metallidurans TaxID=1482676 RepID=A0ABP3CAT9_9MICO